MDVYKFVWEYFNVAIFRGIEKKGYFESLGRIHDSKLCLQAAIDTIEYIRDINFIGWKEFEDYEKMGNILKNGS